jgi:IS30 family transposase
LKTNETVITRQEIATATGRSVSTVARELARQREEINPKPVMDAEIIEDPKEYHTNEKVDRVLKLISDFSVQDWIEFKDAIKKQGRLLS